LWRATASGRLSASLALPSARWPVWLSSLARRASGSQIGPCAVLNANLCSATSKQLGYSAGVWNARTAEKRSTLGRCSEAQRQMLRPGRPGRMVPLVAGRERRNAPNMTRTRTRTGSLVRLKSSRSKREFLNLQEADKVRQFPHTVGQSICFTRFFKVAHYLSSGSGHRHRVRGRCW
jgi:hypothetical protein